MVHVCLTKTNNLLKSPFCFHFLVRNRFTWHAFYAGCASCRSRDSNPDLLGPGRREIMVRLAVTSEKDLALNVC